MAVTAELQSTGMLSREQLLHLFNRFALLTSEPDVKKRIANAVKDGQEAVAVTAAIQDSIFLEMGIDPRFGISYLGKVNMVYENDPDLMFQFYKFVANEETACDEAELGPIEFADKVNYQQKLQEKVYNCAFSPWIFQIGNAKRLVQYVKFFCSNLRCLSICANITWMINLQFLKSYGSRWKMPILKGRRQFFHQNRFRRSLEEGCRLYFRPLPDRLSAACMFSDICCKWSMVEPFFFFLSFLLSFLILCLLQPPVIFIVCVLVGQPHGW